MNVKYRHFSEPDLWKVVNLEIGYGNPSPFGPPCRDMTLEEYQSFKLEQFAKDKETGRILEYEVIDDLTADKLRKQPIFGFYKNHLLKDCGQYGQFRFNVIEYVCQFAKIDPIEMAVVLRKEGRVIAFDDSSISRGENVRKRKMVEMAFAEAMKEGSVDDLISKAEEKKKEPVMNGVGRDLGER